MNLFKRIQFFDSTHINHWSFKFPELEYVGKIKIAGDRKHSNPFLQKNRCDVRHHPLFNNFP